MAQNLETGLIINKLNGDTVGLNVQNSDALINGITIGIGGEAGDKVTSNTALGYQSLYGNYGAENVGVGYQSLTINAGSGNTAIGYQVLYNQTNCSWNTAIGYKSMYNHQGGESNKNVAIGVESMYYSTGAEKNVGVGYRTLYNLNLNDLITPFRNTGIGYESLYYTTIGNDNTAIGSYSGPPSLTYSALTNTTCLGANSIVTKDNSVILGNPNDTNIMVGIGTSAPDDSAKLQIDSTTKGFLPPRMSAPQAEAINGGNPAEGLMVYINDQTGGSSITSKGWWGYSTSGWVKIGP